MNFPLAQPLPRKRFIVPLNVSNRSDGAILIVRWGCSGDWSQNFKVLLPVGDNCSYLLYPFPLSKMIMSSKNKILNALSLNRQTFPDF